MNEPPAPRPATVPAHLETLRQQLERLGREPGRPITGPSGMQRPTQEPPLFRAGK
jgi:hypothetical protein